MQLTPNQPVTSASQRQLLIAARQAIVSASGAGSAPAHDRADPVAQLRHAAVQWLLANKAEILRPAAAGVAGNEPTAARLGLLTENLLLGLGESIASQTMSADKRQQLGKALTAMLQALQQWRQSALQVESRQPGRAAQTGERAPDAPVITGHPGINIPLSEQKKLRKSRKSARKNEKNQENHQGQRTEQAHIETTIEADLLDILDWLGASRSHSHYDLSGKPAGSDRGRTRGGLLDQRI